MFSLKVADASTWLTEEPWSCCAVRYGLTEDAGATWSQIETPGFPNSLLVGSADDGSFRLLGRIGSGDTEELQVFRVKAGTAEPLGPVLHGDIPHYNALSVSADGATWLVHRAPSQGSFVLSIIGDDGSLNEVPLPGGEAYEWEAMRTVSGMRLLRYRTGSTAPSYEYEKVTFRLEPNDELVPADTFPLSLEEGEWMISSRFAVSSWDGGLHWAAASFFVVPRAPASGAPRFLNDAGVISERYSPFLFRGTGLEMPEGVSAASLVDAGTSLIAWGQHGIYVHDPTLPPLPETIGNLQPDTQRMLARADVFRADAGLPPLTGDASISTAARNHSNYTMLNPTDANLSAHDEQPGRPGFTGTGPWDRCEAVGTNCNSEVMYGPGVADPVGGWLATIYHRPLFGSPRATLVGAAEVPGGWAVGDGSQDQNVLVAPFGYPNGRWRGESGFSGEIPDPVDACHGSGQNVEYPLGIAVSLYLPSKNGTVSRIEVHRHGDPLPLKGCLLADNDDGTVGAFILDDPLTPHQTYDVSASWNPGGEEAYGEGPAPGADLNYSWSFYFDPDPLAQQEEHTPVCRALELRTITSAARQRRAGRGWQLGIEEKVRLKTKALVHLRQARLIYWKAHVRHSVELALGRLRRKPKVVDKTSYLRFRLPGQVRSKVEPGEAAELVLAFTGRRLKGCKQVVHIDRIRKFQFGWVRVHGPAAWVSARSRKRR